MRPSSDSKALASGTWLGSFGFRRAGFSRIFGSKEALQVQVLRAAAERFAAEVIRPAIERPRGRARVRALFENWLAWGLRPEQAGGCLFVQSSAEFDDRPGPARDQLVELQSQWTQTLATLGRHGVEAGDFREDLSSEAFAQELYGIMLSLHHYHRLLRDPSAESRARRIFDDFLNRCQRRPQ